MFDYLALCESKQVIERAVNAHVPAFADAKYEVAFGKHTMDPVVVDTATSLILDF